MQEKIIDEMKYWGEEEDYTQDNLEYYERFKWEIEGIVNYPDDYTKEQILEKLKEELKDLERVLR